MKRISSKETLYNKEDHEYLTATHGTSVCAYRSENGRFLGPLFKGAAQYCGHHITYCDVISNRQNTIVGFKIKELTLVSRTLLLYATRVWT